MNMLKKILATMLAFGATAAFAVHIEKPEFITCVDKSTQTKLDVTCSSNAEDCYVFTTVLWGNNAPYALKSFGGADLGKSATFQTTLDPSVSYRLEVTSYCPTYRLTPETDGHGSLTITPEYARIDSLVTITANPDEGYELESISSNTVSLKGSGNTRTCSMPKNGGTVSAKFKPIDYSITNTAPEESGAKGYLSVFDLNDLTKAHVGDGVTITATTEEGYGVDSVWYCMSENCEVSERKKIAEMSGDYILAMPAGNVWIGAELKLAEYAITTFVYNSIGGSLTAPASGKMNDSIVFSFSADDGYRIKSVFVKKGEAEPESVEFEINDDRNGGGFRMPAASVKIGAEFQKVYKVELEEAENGTVSFGDEYFPISTTYEEFADGTVYLRVTPNLGFEVDFLKVVKTGTDEEVPVHKNENQFTFNMPASDVVVTSGFKALPASSSSSEKVESSSSSSENVESSSSSEKVESSSSSSENVVSSSSSVKSGSSSSKKVATSSSSSKKAVSSSSSSKKVATSSSSSKKATSSSSSTNRSSSSAKAKSSSSKGKDAIVAKALLPKFNVTTVARDVKISDASVGSAYAILDMQGRVMNFGRVHSADFSLTVPCAGRFLVRIGHETRIVNVK